jgi:hypothetical protein
MKHGVKAGQLAELRTTYKDPEDLKAFQAAYDKGFKNDPELFANIVTVGLKAETEVDEDSEKEAKDLSIQNLKKLTDAFADPKDLGNLMAGFASKDKVKEARDKTKNTPKDKAEQASADKKIAGERMAALLNNHFAGDPAKLKDPFLDKLNNLQTEHKAWQAELAALNAKEQAFANFEKLAKKAQDQIKPKPKALTGPDTERQTYLNKLLTAYTPLPLETTIRNAASFKNKKLKPADLVMPTADLKGLKCDTERVEHFATRHTRDHFPFGDGALAPANTPLDSDQHKTTTLWPEGTDVAQVKLHLKAALAAIAIPTYASIPIPPHTPPPKKNGFLQKDVSITVGGTSIEVRIGFQTQAPSTVKITQFYPKSSSKLDTIPFEDMHGIKKGLDI